MKVYLTFDCEDFINLSSSQTILNILDLLRKYDLPGIFFLTGQVCETLSNNPDVLDLLKTHEIGYHSSSHSVHPGIFEYTDTMDYDVAYRAALKRETSKINPLTGEIDGPGGLLALKKLFPRNKIVSFRAPGFCWSPPHLEALGQLGVMFDFSTNLSPIPIEYKKTTFYPFPILGAEMLTSPISPLGSMKKTTLVRLAGKSVKSYPLVFFMHPHDLFVSGSWDSDYFTGNPKQLRPSGVKRLFEITRITRCFELFLKRIQFLKTLGILEVPPRLEEGLKKTSFSTNSVVNSYRRSVTWCTGRFNYHPKFLLKHFYQYFELERD